MSETSSEFESIEPKELSPRERLKKNLTSYHLELGGRFGILEDRLSKYAEEAVNKAVEEVDKSARMDSKFEILNSEGLKHELEFAVELANRYGLPLSAAFVDLKGLKAINENPELGQEAGDKAIHITVAAIKSQLRKSDIAGKTLTSEQANNGYFSEIAAREGGDEFVVLYLGTGLEGSVMATRRILDTISQHSDQKMPEHRRIFGQPMTGRAGVAQFDPEVDKDGNDFLNRIGAAMYKTKKREGKIGVSAPIYRDNDYQTVIVKNFKTPKTAS